MCDQCPRHRYEYQMSRGEKVCGWLGLLVIFGVFGLIVAQRFGLL